MEDGSEWGQDRWAVVVESHRPGSTREIAPSLANDCDLDSESHLRNATHLIDVETFDFLIEAADKPKLKAWLHRKSLNGMSPLFEAVTKVVAFPTLPLDMVRSLLGKCASLEAMRYTRSKFTCRKSKLRGNLR